MTVIIFPRWTLAVTAALCVVLASCGTPPPSATSPVAADADWVAQARKIGQDAPQRLVTVLTDELAKGGPEHAVSVCRDKAPAMAKSASEQTGWSVKRVSLRNRNPQAVPDAWERAALEDFDRRAAANEPPPSLERADVVEMDGRRWQRYIRALPVAEMCTQCHGTPDRIKPATAARLDALYPADRATGYTVGQIRGAITLRRPAP